VTSFKNCFTGTLEYVHNIPPHLKNLSISLYNALYFG